MDRSGHALRLVLAVRRSTRASACFEELFDRVRDLVGRSELEGNDLELGDDRILGLTRFVDEQKHSSERGNLRTEARQDEAVRVADRDDLLRVRIREHRPHRVRQRTHVRVRQVEHGVNQRRRLIRELLQIVGQHEQRVLAQVRTSRVLQTLDHDDLEMIGSDLRADEVVDDHHDLEEVVEVLLRDLFDSEQTDLRLLELGGRVFLIGEVPTRGLLAGGDETLERHRFFRCSEVQDVGISSVLDRRDGITVLDHSRQERGREERQRAKESDHVFRVRLAA